MSCVLSVVGRAGIVCFQVFPLQPVTFSEVRRQEQDKFLCQPQAGFLQDKRVRRSRLSAVWDQNRQRCPFSFGGNDHRNYSSKTLMGSVSGYPWLCVLVTTGPHRGFQGINMMVSV